MSSFVFHAASPDRIYSSFGFYVPIDFSLCAQSLEKHPSSTLSTDHNPQFPLRCEHSLISFNTATNDQSHLLMCFFRSKFRLGTPRIHGPISAQGGTSSLEHAEAGHADMAATASCREQRTWRQLENVARRATQSHVEEILLHPALDAREGKSQVKLQREGIQWSVQMRKATECCALTGGDSSSRNA